MFISERLRAAVFYTGGHAVGWTGFEEDSRIAF